mgnify:CR=1 FL=1
MPEASLFKPPYRREWPVKHLLVAWVVGLLISSILTPALDGPAANHARGLAHVIVFGVILIRIIVAGILHEKSIGWAFWFLVTLFFAPIWIFVLEPILWQFR